MPIANFWISWLFGKSAPYSRMKLSPEREDRICGLFSPKIDSIG